MLHPPQAVDPNRPDAEALLKLGIEGTWPEYLDYLKSKGRLINPSLRRQYGALSLAREVVDGALHRHIKQWANQRWELAGRPDGLSDRFWLEAEAEVRSEFPPPE